MKKLTTIVLAVMLLLSLVINIQANTDTPAPKPILEQVKDTAREQVATNINQVVVEMLSGVKSASGEIYGASKTAVKGAVDFAVKEAPDVVRQFLLWKFLESFIYWAIWMTVAIVLFWVGVHLRNWAKKQPEKDRNDDSVIAAWVIGWVVTGVAFLLVFGHTANHGLDMAQIGVAPKVYLIEYVVETVKGQQPNK